ncbi:hypothetical protein KCU64_g13939, partial [Aureobasidium melanogenum]
MSSSKSPSASPISSTATALVLLSSATIAASQAVTPAVAANVSSTGLQVVTAVPSSGDLTLTSTFSAQPSSPSASTSSTANKALSSASETSIASETSSEGTLTAISSAVSSGTPASTTSSSITTPTTTSTSTSSSVTATSSSSITSILTASGSSTIVESSSLIPSSILILPTTTPSPSSTASSGPSITTATASSESNTSNPSATSFKSTSHKLSSQEIAGISFGAVAAAAILSLILFALYRRRRAREAATVTVANNKHGSFPESAWLYDPRMTPAVASPHRSGSPVSSMHSSVSSSASRRDEALLSAIAIPAVLPQRHVSNPVGRALTSNPPSAAERHRISSSVPEFKLLPPTPSAAAVVSDSTIPSPIAEVTTPKETKRESLPAILKIGGGKKRPLTAAPVMQKVKTGPNKPLPPRPAINAKDRPFSFEAGDDGAQQFGVAK